MTAIGIDFGTTNSVVAVHGPNGAETIAIDEPPANWATLGFDRVLPTVFGVGPDQQPVFGWSAKMMPHDKIEAVKRLFREEEFVTLGGQQFLVEEVATLLFSHMKRRVRDSGLDPRKCVVTVPANSRGLARYRTKLSAGMSGMEVLALINEPTAAAMAHSATAHGDQRILVVDWGGGTLDVTILQTASGVFIEQASKGIQQLGGLDFDARLARSILDTVPESQSWSPIQNAEFRLAVERAKVLLSTQEFTNVALPGGDFRRVTREQFEQACLPLVERVRQPIEKCLSDIGGDSSDIDSVILVGGTCNIPAVRNLVSDILNQEPASGVNPMTAIAEGAAIAASIMSGDLQDNDFFVGTEHALGISALDETAEPSFSTIIPRNHKLPASASRTFYPVHEDQTDVNVEVFEGDPDVPFGDDDNVLLKEFEVPLPDRSGIGERAFVVAFEYDLDGILHVTVTDKLTGEQIGQDNIAFGAGEDKRNLIAIAKRVKKTIDTEIVEKPKAIVEQNPQVAELLQRARTKVIPFLDGPDAVTIRRLVESVENSSGSDRALHVRRLEDELINYSYLF